MDTIAVRQYMANGGGAKSAGFTPEETCEVMVSSYSAANNDRVFQIACDLRNAHEQHVEDQKMIAHLRSKLRESEDKNPPKQPVMLMGPAYIRFDARGALWMLNKRDGKESRGFGESGFVFAGGWDELFRRYNVRVTSSGQDSHGPFWIVENIRD